MSLTAIARGVYQVYLRKHDGVTFADDFVLQTKDLTVSPDWLMHTSRRPMVALEPGLPGVQRDGMEPRLSVSRLT